MPRFQSARLLIAACALLASNAYSQCVSITSAGTPVTENFNTLANSGSSNSLPAGWAIAESGTSALNNGQYTAGTGSSNAGDTYSFGAAASTERALGGLRSGTLVPLFGACFTNNTGVAITKLDISYTGEQWRAGVLNRGAADRLEFQYSTDATSLTVGTYIAATALNFNSPNISTAAGALDGNSAANRTAVSGSITTLNIASGATFWIRWNDFDIPSSDDGLAVDDFSLTANAGGSGSPSLAITTSSPLPAATVGVSYSVTFSGTGGSGAGYAFSLPGGNTPVPGLTLSGATLSGIPATTAGSPFSFAVQLTDSANASVQQTFSLIVNPGCAPDTTIAAVQGSGLTSPVVASVVSVSGIVTGRKSNGFFLQMPSPGDGDPATSDGIFVFTGSAPPAAAAVGNGVCVRGTVSEFSPSTDPIAQPLTEISGSPFVLLNSTGNSLPAPVALTASELNAAASATVLEKYEGMRVSVASLSVYAPTGSFVSEVNATATTNGVFAGALTGTARAFREPGVQLPDALPAGAPATTQRWDGNPEIIAVDSDALGAAAIDISTGATVTGIAGPLDYSNRLYTIDLDPSVPAPVVTGGNLTFTAVPQATANELTVATMNLERFFDTTDDPSVSDVALTATAFANRLNKLSLSIRNVMRMPDVIGVEEMENLATLQAVAQKINNDAAAAGQPSPNYLAFLFEGNDIGGIDVGFLVKSPRVTPISVTQLGKSTTYIDPNSGVPALLNDRPPVLLEATVPTPSGTPMPFTVIVNHLRSLGGIADPADGDRVRVKRAEQAKFLANLIQSRQTANPAEKIVSVGDYNAFQFSDGYVDVIGTIKGTPVAPSLVTLATPDLVSPDLTDLVEKFATPDQQYSYVFGGNAQVLDHIIANPNLANRVTRFATARVNADFAGVLRSDANRPERYSDHDHPVAYFSLATDSTSGFQVTSSPFFFGRLTQTYSGSVTIRNTSGASINGPFSVVFGNLAAGITVVNPAGTLGGAPYLNFAVSGSLAAGATATVNVQFRNPSNLPIAFAPQVWTGGIQ